jgi:DNA-binding GntR family transcriptional regulator
VVSGAQAEGIDRLPTLGHPLSLAENLHRVLEEAIVNGDLAPGSKLNVDRLARQLGVSIIPVRETLRALEAQGWVRFRPRYGAYVREYSRVEALDVHEARQVLEAEVASLAAKHRTAESLSELLVLVEKGESAARRGEPEEFLRINGDFHGAVASAAQNSVLAELSDHLALRVRFYFASAVSYRVTESAAEHRLIYEAIEGGDRRRAAQLARKHVAATRAKLVTIFSE